MTDSALADEEELVDGIPWEEHRRYYDALPWYALPVANLFSDANLGAWWGISLVLFAMKFFAVAAATNATVAALVLCVSVLTALLWFAVFVLVGSEDHRLLYREMPFGKIAQTFWVGAIACPLGVYAVRAVIGAVMTFFPFFATPEEVLYGGGGDYEDAYADRSEGGEATGASAEVAVGNAVLVAFVVAYFAAGLAEEIAKYFGVSRYYPTWQTLQREQGVSVDAAGKQGPGPPGSIPEGGARPRVGCASPAAGWFAPARNPRVVVYLAFVVGLGFSFTENIQYGANVYEAATAWGEQGNVTMRRNVTLNPFPDAILAVDTSVGDIRATGDAPYARAAAVLDAAVAEEKRVAGIDVGAAGAASAAEAAAEPPSAPTPGAPSFGAAVRDVLEVVSAVFRDWAGADDRVVQADVDAALVAALEEIRNEAAARVGERRAVGAPREKKDASHSSSFLESRIVRSRDAPRSRGAALAGRDDRLSSSARGKKILVEERGGIGVVDVFGADAPEDMVREIDDAGAEAADLPDDWSGLDVQNVTVSITVRRRPYTETAKWGAATTVTLLRGVTPMHAVWAGLTSTRYVSRLWVERAASAGAFGAIAWSWLYHGTFDFAIMAAPALVASGADASCVFAVLGTGFATMIWSWSHLVKATFALEKSLTRAGFAAADGGRGVPRLGVCTGGDRRTCCCACMPCVWALCPGLGDWDDAEEGDEESMGEGYGATR